MIPPIPHPEKKTHWSRMIGSNMPSNAHIFIIPLHHLLGSTQQEWTVVRAASATHQCPEGSSSSPHHNRLMLVVVMSSLWSLLSSLGCWWLWFVGIGGGCITTNDNWQTIAEWLFLLVVVLPLWWLLSSLEWWWFVGHGGRPRRVVMTVPMDSVTPDTAIQQME